MTLETRYEFRGDMVRRLIQDLQGPSHEEEVLDDAPITRYIAGILYPRTSEALAPDLDVDTPDDDDEATTADPPVAMANVRYPSSIGLTFSIDTSRASQLRVVVDAGRYEPVGEPSAERRTSGRRRSREAVPAQKWRRIPVRPAPVIIDVSRTILDHRSPLVDGLELFHRVRPTDTQGRAAITVVLLNTRLGKPGERDADAFFQPSISVTAEDEDACPFVERPSGILWMSDEDQRSYQLLYRHAHLFATGHGCSVEWEVTQGASANARRLWTTATPQYELALSDSNPDIDTSKLSMYTLGHAPRGDVLAALEEFCEGYERWIGDRRDDAKSLTGVLHETADDHLDSCVDAVGRIRRGLAVLAADARAWEAFRLANRAMLAQRSRTDWLVAPAGRECPEESTAHRWRPFQIAFILLCLEGIVDVQSPRRDMADLLWFPTGGGKTEAYLGLIAFTVFLRRLRSGLSGAGVTVLMRYTLRLLTIQQFERAALLICSCEAIRRKRDDLGDEPISIGLWVGRGGTPNTLDDARRSLDKLRQGVTLSERNPVQVHSCPWCGVPLGDRNYFISEGSPRRMIISCRNTACEFRDGLPVHVVDEDVYRRRPTLIIATVDKFAGLPWQDEVAHLFNIGSPYHRPELIIQDELHLISGPLGTLVGLYETAVDLLCTEDGVRPKLIASTATIRRAGEQAKGLFDREVRQFPPPGIDSRDSYFAVEAPSQAKGTRQYLGLMAPGTSQTTLLVRTYAALLQGASETPGTDEDRDPYWTLVGYFNSLRVLGGARMQVQDDVGDRIELLANMHGAQPRPIEQRIELTSREPSSDIPAHLKAMARALPAERTLDVILATNMISVGVDIERLGLMVVMGQPQSTSEYIQATSRVGRRYPGLVVVLFNAARSRDRSHYESFVAYHSAIYRQVESTSVTPFSARARDRGLHGVVVALARLLIPQFRPNAGAAQIAGRRAALDAVVNAIRTRVERVSPDEAADTVEELERLLSEWEHRLSEHADLVYSHPHQEDRALLVEASGAEGSEDGGLPTIRSLRDVDKASNLYLVR